MIFENDLEHCFPLEEDTVCKCETALYWYFYNLTLRKFTECQVVFQQLRYTGELKDHFSR